MHVKTITFFQKSMFGFETKIQKEKIKWFWLLFFNLGKLINRDYCINLCGCIKMYAWN